MKILNLYAGIGGNRKLWGDEHEITSVEFFPYIAEAYQKLYPNDTLVIGDAHQYLLDHYQEFDFIWSSPPCPTHSRMNHNLVERGGKLSYPDMKLYEEILFLKHMYDGLWVVENVIPYYKPLVEPALTIDRHLIWSNIPISNRVFERGYTVDLTRQIGSKEILAGAFGIELPEGTKDQRKLLRNAVDPRIGQHILEAALKETKQESML